MTDGDETLEEILDRARRIETKLSAFMESQGFSAHGDKPVFYDEVNELVLPSRNMSLRDCLLALPADWTGSIDIYVNEDYLVSLHMEE